MADFYLDHNVAAAVADLLRAANHTAVTALDAGLERARDDEHLLYASQRGSILVTHNRTDFVLFHGAWHRWASAWGVAQTHAGVLIVPQPPVVTNAQIAAELGRFIAKNPLLTNELYRWRASDRWQRLE